MNFGLAISPSGFIERARGALSMGTSISSYQVNCISSAVNTFLGFSQFGETELKDKKLETDLVKTAIQNILLQKDISATDIDTVSKIFASKKLRDKFSLWISKKPTELKSMMGVPNVEGKILKDIMVGGKNSSLFPQWLKHLEEKQPSYCKGDFRITPFGIFYKDGTPLYIPDIPHSHIDVKEFTGSVIEFRGKEYFKFSFVNTGGTKKVYIIDKKGNTLHLSDKNKVSYKVRDIQAPNRVFVKSEQDKGRNYTWRSVDENGFISSLNSTLSAPSA